MIVLYINSIELYTLWFLILYTKFFWRYYVSCNLCICECTKQNKHVGGERKEKRKKKNLFVTLSAWPMFESCPEVKSCFLFWIRVKWKFSFSWVFATVVVYVMFFLHFQGASSAGAPEECVCVSWCGHACSGCWRLCPSLHQHDAGRSCQYHAVNEWYILTRSWQLRSSSDNCMLCISSVNTKSYGERFLCSNTLEHMSPKYQIFPLSLILVVLTTLKSHFFPTWRWLVCVCMRACAWFNVSVALVYFVL